MSCPVTSMPGPAEVPSWTVVGEGAPNRSDVALVEHLHHPEVLLAALQDHFQERAEVEVHVGHGGEQGLFGEGVDRLVDDAEPPGVMGVGRHALQTVEQRLLQRLDVLVLAAHAGAGGAPGAPSGLFALVTKHERLLG